MIFVSCKGEDTLFTELFFEKDLIPEGIALDTESNRLFLSSLRNKKIVSSRLDGSNAMNVIQSGQYDYLSGFGLLIKGDTLYALGNSLPRTNNKSILLLLDKNTGNLIQSYKLNDPSCIYLNDLTITNSNDIFITDSESNRIYKIKRPEKTLEVFLESDEVIHSNGITISPDNKYLYLASQKGIRVVDIDTKRILNKSNKNFAGIDGLKYYENSLIGIVNAYRDQDKNGMFRYYLNNMGNEITHKRKLISFDESFNVPTTFDIIDGQVYFIMNSQLDNLNLTTNEIINQDSLALYVLMKKKIITNESHKIKL